MEVNNKYQVLTSLPNANEKHIDYVLVYRNIDDNDTKINKRFKRKCIENRRRFFDRLEKESFEIKNIQADDKKNEFVYALLHCSTERLLKEAEYTNLEMKIKKPGDEANVIPVKVEQKGLKKITKTLNRPLKDDGSGQIKSYRFDSSIRFIFEGVDDPAKPEGPFNSTTRILLTSNILNNLVYRSVNQGLPYMLDHKYIDDAFILHDQTTDESHLKNVFNFVNQSLKDNELGNDFINNYMATVRSMKKEDKRKKLNDKWAKFRNFFRLQPMWDIRNYFGEEYALYFAWMGTFVLSLWIIGLIGLGLCLVGILVVNTGAFTSLSSSINNATSNSLLNSVFKSTFDNNITPLYAFALCIWGIIFVEYWKRENIRLAYEWDVENYEKYEPDLPEYKRRQAELKEYLSRKGKIGKFLFINIDPVKRFISFLIIMLLLAVVCLEIGALVLYRLYFTITVFPNNSTYSLIVADIGSTVINSIFIIVIQYFYTKLAKALTKWENHRNVTEFQDALVIKLFTFNFINNYGSLFYLSYFRQITYPNGFFGLGSQYQDSCSNNNCMSLLSLQVFILLLIQPLPRFFTTVIVPAIAERRKKKEIDHFFTTHDHNSIQSENYTQDKNFEFDKEKAILLYLSIEKAKTDPSETIIDEFTEKVIIYGYLILFGASFSLGPLLVLLLYLFDIRIDGKRLLWLFRRPVGVKAQDIGSWASILKCLTVLGIVNHGFLLAFTSNWAKTFFSTSTYSFAFAIAFEHALFIIWFLVTFFSPELPNHIKEKMREDTVVIKKIIKEAKHKNDAELEDEQPDEDDEFMLDGASNSFIVNPEDGNGEISVALPNPKTLNTISKTVKPNTITPQNIV